MEKPEDTKDIYSDHEKFWNHPVYPNEALTHIKIAADLVSRARSRLAVVKDFLLGDLAVSSGRLCGGALLHEVPKDFDIFTTTRGGYDHLGIGTDKPVGHYDFRVHGIDIQLCRYWEPDLIRLISGFDFAHCQVGVEFELKKSGASTEMKITGIAFTTHFLTAMATGLPYYLPESAKWPHKSLERLGRVASKFNLTSLEKELIRSHIVDHIARTAT